MNDISPELEAWMDERHDPKLKPTPIRWQRSRPRRVASA